MKTLLNIGDSVKIRDDIERSKNYYMKLSGNYDSYTAGMIKSGNFVTIKEIIQKENNKYYYKLKEDCLFSYTDEMFDPALIDFLYEDYLMNN